MNEVGAFMLSPERPGGSSEETFEEYRARTRRERAEYYCDPEVVERREMLREHEEQVAKWREEEWDREERHASVWPRKEVGPGYLDSGGIVLVGMLG